MKEMTAIEYLKTKNRIVKADTRGSCTIACTECPFAYKKNGTDLGCYDFERKYPEKAEELVRKWAEEHPVKTMIMDLLEKYPNVLMGDDGAPESICPHFLGYEKKCHCGELNCNECWNRPLEGGDV